jgi:light-regulated signal transduction histidine kinase (bacteriophytochrome)
LSCDDVGITSIQPRRQAMLEDLESLGRQYTAALQVHLTGNDSASLVTASELAHRMRSAGLGLLDAFAIHEKALAVPGSPALSAAASADACSKANGFFREVLSVFETALPQRWNETLEQQRIEIEAANKELESFRYSVSHDLRAPLRAIDGFSAILEEQADRLDDDGRHCLQIVRSSAQRMGHLIDDMLLLVRVGRGDLNRERIDVSEMAQEIAAKLQQQEPERRVDFDLQPNLTAVADRKLLHIVVENLLGNAWKFTSKTPEAHVGFGATESPQGRAFFVRDNGVGFSMEYAARLFNPFQRLHSESEFPGTGIGLAVVRRIVERHGGQVWADAAVDRGTTLFFTLPPPAEAARG